MTLWCLSKGKVNDMHKAMVLDWRATPLFYKLMIVLYVIVMLAYGFYVSELTVIIFGVFGFLIYSTNPFFASDKEELYLLSQTLPIKRSQIVKGRFVNSIVMLVVGLVMGLAITPLVWFFADFPRYGLREYTAIVVFSILLFALLHMFMYPLMFKYEYRKASILGLYLPTGLIFVFYYVVMIPSDFAADFVSFALENLLLVHVGMGVLAVIFMLLSYIISMRLFCRRDF